MSGFMGVISCGRERLSCERCQQGLGLLQVGGVKPLGEPAVNRCQQRTRFGLLALLLPQALRLHGGAASRPASRQLPRCPRPRASGDHRDSLTRAAGCHPQSSKSLDTTSRAVYALPVRRRVAGGPATMTPPPIKEMSMTKADLVDQVATTVDFSKAQTASSSVTLK